MPPSGFSSEQVTYVSSFLRSCGDELLTASARKGTTLAEEAAAEISTITGYLSGSREAVLAAILAGLAEFYAAVLEELEQNGNREVEALASAVEKVRGQFVVLKV